MTTTLSAPRRRPLPAFLAFSTILFAAACGDQGPGSGPGDLTATVVSPNGAEGAALVLLVGEGMGPVSPLSGRAFGQQVGDTLRVVLINDAGGDLAFTVAVADTARPPTGVLVEVAGPDDEIRPLAGYDLEVRR